jgi:hypothetical protein
MDCGRRNFPSRIEFAKKKPSAFTAQKLIPKPAFEYCLTWSRRHSIFFTEHNRLEGTSWIGSGCSSVSADIEVKSYSFN